MYEAVREVFKDAFAKERQEGINEDKERVAVEMLKDGEPLAKIVRYSRLAEGVVRITSVIKNKIILAS